ncbi:hypothetical protein [Butyrivibrio sp. AC2005]|uniref:hypothetical protein n=1 Tax=Butyrivibrio sp. AC2005 TaxID=1280672 RepID=UPI0003F5F956|nr:hypothetical protein [Butyrivibrio sp. AC2005]
MKKAFNICIAIVDIALLVVILTSAFAKKEDRDDYQSSRIANEEYSEEAANDYYSESNDIDKNDYRNDVFSESTGKNAVTEDWLLGDNQGTDNQAIGEQGNDNSHYDSSDSYNPADWEESIQPKMTMKDFDWFNAGILVNGIPEEAEKFDDFERLKGKWRVYIHNDPQNESGEEADFLLYVDISGNPDNVVCTFEWYWAHYYNNPEVSLGEADNSYLYGTYANNVLHADGAVEMDLKYFVAYDGYDHILGTMEDKNGTQAIIAMIKP